MLMAKTDDKSIIVDFVNWTTASGFRPIYDSTIVWRIIWIVCILAGWTFAIYQSTMLIQKYLQYESIVTIQIEVVIYLSSDALQSFACFSHRITYHFPP